MRHRRRPSDPATYPCCHALWVVRLLDDGPGGFVWLVRPWGEFTSYRPRHRHSRSRAWNGYHSPVMHCVPRWVPNHNCLEPDCFAIGIGQKTLSGVGGPDGDGDGDDLPRQFISDRLLPATHYFPMCCRPVGHLCPFSLARAFGVLRVQCLLRPTSSNDLLKQDCLVSNFSPIDCPDNGIRRIRALTN